MIDLSEYNGRDVSSVAGYLADQLERVSKPRDHDQEYSIVATVRDCPQFVTDIMLAAHGDMGPDDRRYEAINSILDRLRDSLDETSVEDDMDRLAHECCDAIVDVYNGRRSAWLASNLQRAGYVDEAREDGLIADGAGIFDQLGAGQYYEAREIFLSLCESIQNILDIEGACYRYVAGWNLPGCLPDAEPVRFLSFEDAREYISDELDHRADEYTESHDLAETDEERDRFDRLGNECADQSRQALDETEPFSGNVAGSIYWVENVGFTIDAREL